MEDTLVPIFICCVLPVSIVFIVFWTSLSQKRINAKVLIEALSHDDHVDVNKLAEQLNMKEGQNNDPVSTLHRRLLRGSTCTLLGVGLLIIAMLLNEPGPFFSDSQIFVSLGSIACFCVGIGNLVVYFVTRKRVLRDSDRKNESTDDRILPGE